MTKIPWAEKSWNPISGCSPISPGCANCYARRMAYRLRGRFGYPQNAPFAVTHHPDKLDDPLKWVKPCRIFVCSMGDLFHKDATLGQAERVWDTMFNCGQHIFMVLTKRPGNLLTFAQWMDKAKNRRIDYNNVWLGVSVESPDYYHRIDTLRQIPAAVKFISFEPLLGPVDDVNLEGVDWVICGCEAINGRPGRETDIWHIRHLKDRCVEAGVPFFLKQKQGPFRTIEKMPILDGKMWDKYPGRINDDRD